MHPVLSDLAKSSSSTIKAEVAEVIGLICVHLSGVWGSHKKVLLEVLDKLLLDKDIKLRSNAADIKNYGIRPVQVCVREKAEELMPYALLTNLAQPGKKESDYWKKETGSEAFSLPPGYSYAKREDIPEAFRAFYDPETGLIEDPDTSLKAALFKCPKGEVVLAFSGTESGTGERAKKGWDINWDQAMGKVPPLFVQAQKLAAAVKGQYKEKLVITGHSQGGALAQFAGISLECKTICFNSAGLGSGTRQWLIYFMIKAGKKPNIHKIARENVTHVNLEGEALSGYVEDFRKTTRSYGGTQHGKVLIVPIADKYKETGAVERHSAYSVWESLKYEAYRHLLPKDSSNKK